MNNPWYWASLTFFLTLFALFPTMRVLFFFGVKVVLITIFAALSIWMRYAAIAAYKLTKALRDASDNLWDFALAIAHVGHERE